MTDRDRLIKLFEAVEKDPAITCPHYKTDKTCDTCKYTINNFMCNHTERMIDYLLANGVIVPPCEVGDVVYYLNQRCHVHLLKHTVYEAVVVKLVVFKDDIYVVIKICDTDGVVEISQISDFGLNLFKTKEEAEKVVKEFFK